MSEIRLNIVDKNQVLIGDIHGSMCDVLIASLTAEPETIEELETALDRFVKFESDWGFFGRLLSYEFDEPLEFRNHLNLEKWDAGIVVIDLVGRTILDDSTYNSFSRKGTIGVQDELDNENEEEFGLPYQLSDDWEFVRGLPEFEGVAKNRREERLNKTPIDARKVLYGDELFEFLVKEIQNANELEDKDLFTDIHRKWLMSARDNLDGKTPREVLFEKHDFVSFELHSRFLQWSYTKQCPPNIPISSNAYKFAGFGTHEIVVYYDLIRFLLEMYYIRLKEDKVLDVELETKYLEDFAYKWLNTNNQEFSGRKPADIIESERIRRNLTMSSHECLIDEDCPMCVEMSEMFDTPMFWFLDGCNMEVEFAFSFCKTIEEWDEKQREFEEFNREFEAKRLAEKVDSYSILDENIID